MKIDLTGKRAFVSGSTQGIGRVIAAGLAAAGASTTINGRDAERVADVVEQLRRELPQARIDGIAADVATAAGAEAVLEALPAVDVLVNNLGIFAPTPVLEIDDENSLIQRLIEPEEIANMVVYLASEQASATTGGALRVDGGYVDNIVP